MQLAMVRMVSVVRSPSHAPSPAHTETCALPSRRWRDAVFEVPFRPSSRTEQVCGAKHDGVMRFSPSLKPELTIHLLYPFLVCAFGEQRKRPSIPHTFYFGKIGSRLKATLMRGALPM